MKNLTQPICLSACLLLSLAPLATQAQEISGSFQHQGKLIKPTNIAAFRVPHFRDASKLGTAVFLTMAPLDTATAAAAARPDKQAKSQPAASDQDRIVLHFWDDGSSTYAAKFGDKFMEYMDTKKSGLNVQITSTTEDQITARVWSGDPPKYMAAPKYSIDVTFSSAITRK